MLCEVLCVRCSPTGKWLAICLTDSTIKVLHIDSLTFTLSFYGHKLPALSMDFSGDGTLLASGGSDKKLRIWSLNNGYCRGSLFAHRDSITQVIFLRKTHFCLSSSKDCTVR